jgi:hypothetical protein
MDEMGEPLFRVFYQWAGGERPAGLHAIVADRQSPWFDDIATIEKRETRDDIYILAARDAAEMVQAEFGGGSGRAWDRVHAITFEHPLGQGSWWRSWLFSRGPVPITGDGTTVMRVSWNRSRPFHGWELPSWRQVFDVGEWDQARVIRTNSGVRANTGLSRSPEPPSRPPRPTGCSWFPDKAKAKGRRQEGTRQKARQQTGKGQPVAPVTPHRSHLWHPSHRRPHLVTPVALVAPGCII